MDDHDRRIYDMEIADLRVQVEALSTQSQDIRDSNIKLHTEMALLRGDVKDLIDAWNTAKGVTSFVKWLAGVIIACGVIVAFYKGGK